MGFHSPLECARILAKHGHAEPVKYPDYGSKEKALELNKQFVEGKPPKLS